MLSEIGEVLSLVLLQIVSVSLLASLGDADSDKWQVPTIGSTKCFTRRGKYSDFRERWNVSNNLVACQKIIAEYQIF